MRRALKLLIILGIGLALAGKNKDTDTGGTTGKNSDGSDAGPPTRYKGFDGNNTAEAHDTADARLEDGEAGTATNNDTADTSDTTSTTDANPNVPDHATETLEYIRENGAAPPGYGLPKWQGKQRQFKNKDEDLPTQDGDGDPITYTEFDVHPFQPGVNRGAERIVMGSDGRAWYTDDHYETFTLVEE